MINKTLSKTYSDQTKFYTSDTALELNFQLKEVEYDFDSAEIILLNVDDRSLVTRPVAKNADGFTYEIEDDIVAHYGEWKGQLKFDEGGEIYVSSPVSFRIENDLTNDRPPQLTEVNTWKNLRKIADGLIDDVRSELELFEEKKLEIESAESERQSAELIRIENENQRNLTSVEEFVKLQDSVGGRNYLLNSASPSAVTFSSNNSSILPIIRGVENGVDYLQSGLEGTFSISTYVPETYVAYAGTKYSEDLSKYTGPLTMSIDIMADVPLNVKFLTSSLAVQTTKANVWTRLSVIILPPTSRPAGLVVVSTDNPNVPADTKVYWRNIKIEKGTLATPYTEAPEDYTTVSKDDYYNHIKMMSEHTRLGIREKADKKQEDWITPTLLNGATGTVQYRKNQMGRVEFRGKSAIAKQTELFRLPLGYRPNESVLAILPEFPGGSTSRVVATTEAGIFFVYGSSESELSLDTYSYPVKEV